MDEKVEVPAEQINANARSEFGGAGMHYVIQVDLQHGAC